MKDIRQSSDVEPARFYPYEQRPYLPASSVQPSQVVNGYMSPQNEKLAELERGQIKLTASQTLAEVSRNVSRTCISNKLMFKGINCILSENFACFFKIYFVLL